METNIHLKSISIVMVTLKKKSIKTTSIACIIERKHLPFIFCQNELKLTLTEHSLKLYFVKTLLGTMSKSFSKNKDLRKTTLLLISTQNYSTLN